MPQAVTSPSVADRKAAVDTLVDLHDGVLGDGIYDPQTFPFMDDRMRRMVALYLDPHDPAAS